MISVLMFGFLWWSSSWWWRPHIAACKLCWSLHCWGQERLFWTNFFCKMYFLHTSRSRKKNFVKFLLVLPPFQGGKTWEGGPKSRIEVKIRKWGALYWDHWFKSQLCSIPFLHLNPGFSPHFRILVWLHTQPTLHQWSHYNAPHFWIFTSILDLGPPPGFNPPSRGVKPVKTWRKKITVSWYM